MSPLFRTRRTNRSTNRITSHRLNFSKSPRARLLLQPLEERAVPAVYLVDTAGDTNAGGGGVSTGPTSGDLRFCWTAANAGGADTITFASGINSALVTSALPTYNENASLLVQGNGAANTNITAPANLRIATLTPGTTQTVTFDGLTMTGNGVVSGNGGLLLVTNSAQINVNNSILTGASATGQGGAIQHGSTSAKLSVTNSQITNNKASTYGGAFAFFNSGSILTITGSTLSGNTAGGNSSHGGGAVYMFGSTSTLRAIDSTFSGNRVTAGTMGGGAIEMTGPLMVTGSTFSGNTAGAGRGGALRVTGITNINLSTFSGNSAALSGGAIYHTSSTNALNVYETTIASNASAQGGGIHRGSTGAFNLFSTVLSDNTAATGPDVSAGTVSSNNAVFMQSTAGVTTFTGGFTGITGSSANLAGLANNGGTTQTRLPNLGSGVLNVGNNNVTTASAIADNVVTSVTVASANGLAVGSEILIDTEVLSITAISGTTLTVIRGFNGSTAAAHAASATVKFAYDQRGSAFPRSLTPNIGAVDGSEDSPGAVMTAIGTIVAPGATPNTVVVTYTAVGANSISVGSITAPPDDITITGPSGALAITGVVASSGVNAPSITATYTFTPPVGAAAGWDASDNGSYTVTMNASQVSDTPGGKSVKAGTLGNFSVLIGQTYKVTLNSDTGSEDTTTVDPNDGDLRWAIGKANADGGTTDSIVFVGVSAISMVGAVAITGPVAIVGSPGTELEFAL